MPIFFVDFGDGTGFGSSGNPRALTSFPPLHVYVQPGTYTVTGYATFNGRAESTAMSVVVGPAKSVDPTPAPAAEKVESGDWSATATPTTETVETVGTTTSAGSLSIGAGTTVISEATSKAPSASSAKAPTVSAKANQVVIVSVPSLPSGTEVDGMVKLGKKWVDLPPGEVNANGQLTLPALTFGKAGTYSVKLTLESGAIKYVTVKVKR
jgi:PKD repeat protein